MNKIIPLVVLATMFTQIVHAQIKRQYKDEKFAKQTVVVKSEESISDLEILNSQFDLDDVSVGEVIRITTETDPKQTPTLPEQVAEEEVIVAQLDTPKEEEIEKIEQEKPEVEVEIEETQKPISTPVKKSVVRSMDSSSKKVKSKRRNPKFKKKKRKRSKRWKTKCYRF